MIADEQIGRAGAGRDARGTGRRACSAQRLRQRRDGQPGVALGRRDRPVLEADDLRVAWHQRRNLRLGAGAAAGLGGPFAPDQMAQLRRVVRILGDGGEAADLAGSHGQQRLRRSPPLADRREVPGGFERRRRLLPLEPETGQRRVLGGRLHPALARDAARRTHQPDPFAAGTPAQPYNDHPVCYLGDLYHYLLMERAREHGITVVLSGQGADELFCGYLKYPWLHLLALMRTGQPFAALRWLRQLHRTGWLASNIQPADAKRYMRQLLPRMGAAWGRDMRGQRLLGAEPADLGVHGTDIAQRQVLDVRRLSVPGLCHIEDRMSMAFSREVRLPYLDPHLARLMLAAPVKHKLQDGWTKYSLRRAADGLVPTEIAWRRDKRGFSVPEGPLLQGPVGDFIESYLSPDSLVFQHGFIDRERWLARFRAFRSGGGAARWTSPREVWAPWAMEVWMRRFHEWLALPEAEVATLDYRPEVAVG